MVVPFFAFLFPMVWYANRNLTSDVLPPRLEPSPELILGALGAGVAVALVLGVSLSALHRRFLATRPNRLRRWVFEPDDRTLAVFAVEAALLALWALPALADLGPDLLQSVLTPLAVLFGLPVLLLLPVTIEASPGAHIVFVLTLMAVPVWMITLASLGVGRLEGALT